MWQYNNADDLYHHGVLGMKWGKRKARSTLGISSKKLRKRISDDASEARGIKKKKVKQMSNSELKKLNERMNLEQNYSNLTKQKSKVNKGMKFVTSAAVTTGTVLTLYNNSGKLIELGKKYLGK